MGNQSSGYEDRPYGYNDVTILGRICTDTDILRKQLMHTKNGSASLFFTVWEKDVYDGNSTFHHHPCRAYGKMAETLSQYAEKGDELLIKGRIRYYESKATNPETGKTAKGTEIIVNSFKWTVGRTKNGGGRSEGESRGERYMPKADFEDDIPF